MILDPELVAEAEAQVSQNSVFQKIIASFSYSLHYPWVVTTASSILEGLDA